MDHVVIAAERYIENQEASQEAACYKEAQIAGLSQEQADTCEAGEYKCSTCPWRDK